MIKWHDIKYSLSKFFACFFGFYFLVLILRFFTTANSLNLVWYQGYHILAALVFAGVCALWKYNIINIILSIIIALIWCGAALCRIGAGMVLTEREIVQTMETGISLYAIFSIIHYGLSYCSKKWLYNILSICNYVIFSLAMLPALLVIGYYVVSDKHMLSSNILLTLFQTNYDEVVSYLVEQNVVLWFISVVLIILVIVAFVYVLSKIKREGHNFKVLAFNVLLIIYMIIGVFPKLSSSFIIGMMLRVSDTLQEYKEYNAVSAAHAERINELHSKIKYDDAPQLHVLVMGESMVRHHLSAFGYHRSTTPWLDDMIEQNQKVILYPNAYSNNIQTVMSIQFALTSQNQYNGVILKDAHSITEVATAAGYKTYWISNQMHHKSYDTPISTIANGADNQIYINEFWGNKLITMYYDDKLVEYFPEAKKNEKTFVVFHLMGCHNVYNDRYPAEYGVFTDGNDARVNSYDNCVLYNDHVLSLLYEKAKQNPDFMSFTFLSDHGEDPDKGLTHDYSKFTWNMAHIPFFSIFSPQYIALHPDVYDNIQKNHEKYWTSDLLYDEMLHILGIIDAPDTAEYFDISSDKYNMPYDKLTIIEGAEYIRNDNSK